MAPAGCSACGQPPPSDLRRAHERRAVRAISRQTKRSRGPRMAFIPHTPDDIARMLEVIGAQSIDDLFDEIPRACAPARSDLPPPIGEMEIAPAHDRAGRERWPAAEFHRRGRL